MVCEASSSCFSCSNQFQNEVNQTESGSCYPYPWDHFLYPPLLNPEHLFLPMVTSTGDKCIDIFSNGSEKGRLRTIPISSHLEGGVASLSNDKDPSKPILNYISQVLREENTERHYMTPDPLALEATERSLHDALGEKHPPNEGSNFHVLGTINDSSNFHTFNFLSITDGAIHDQSRALSRTRDHSDFLSPFSNSFRDCTYQSLVFPSSQASFSPPISFTNRLDDLVCPSTSTIRMPPSNEFALQFQRGQEEASKILLNSIKLIDDVENKSNLLKMHRESAIARIGVNGSKGRKHHEREDGLWMDGKISKVSAILVEEDKLSDLFDTLFCWTRANDHLPSSDGKLQSEGFTLTRKLRASNAWVRAKKRDSTKMVDLRNLLLLCAQAVSINDMKGSTELLKQIRLHSSPNGDGTQRLGHHFANGLEARLAGTRDQNPFKWLITEKLSLAEMIKHYHTYFNACPFHMISISFANNMIVKVSEKAEMLHIIHFGIMYGLHWPLLIQLLAKRPGGPPHLRITGVEIPQQGFRPLQGIEEAGRNLARYCKSYDVPFTFHAIASANWETIKMEEFNIRPNQALAVTCLYRLESLLDETVVENNPRNAVLKMIRAMRPDIFAVSVTNGSHNSPFFLTRFKEALFHFSAIYDMIDSNIPRNNKERLDFERELYGRKAMNVISCEGSDRIERPETYKQWLVRIMQAGFKQIPLDQTLMSIYKEAMKMNGYKDIEISQDSHWLLQGWKGRILYASSCWVPNP